MRYDFFLVWGNAIKHANHIIDILNNDNNFEVVRIVLHEIGDMGRFVQKVYECDSVPIEHLIGKTRYLLKTPPRCLFVLVKNYNPDEAYHGEGAFRHIQCNNVLRLKKEIRNRFNPRFEDKNRAIAPLNPGVSHDHCVHASDYESQVEHILGVLNLESLSHYQRNDHLDFDVPFYLSPNHQYRFINTKLSSLKADLIMEGMTTKPVPIKDTPHYRFLQGDYHEYIDYFYFHMGKGLQSNHFPCTFEKLSLEFKEDYVSRTGKRSFIIIKGGHIKDGLHRACIMLSRGMDEIKCIQIL